MNDKDVEVFNEQLKEDAQQFHSSSDSAVGKSTVRKTGQEKDAKALVEGFQKETENIVNILQEQAQGGPGMVARFWALLSK
jgi:hypothetical protein